jgi:hypothetical protein
MPGVHELPVGALSAPLHPALDSHPLDRALLSSGFQQGLLSNLH